MTAPVLKVSQLLGNARKHLDDVRSRLVAIVNALDAAPVATALDTVHGDLDAMERLLDNMHRDLEKQILRM